MSARFETHFDACTRQWATAARHANRLALESAGSAFGVQLRAFEHSANATLGFFGELAQQGSDLPALLPKGLQLARDNLQRLADAGQDAFGLGLKAGMAIGELARQPFTASPTPPDMAR